LMGMRITGILAILVGVRDRGVWSLRFERDREEGYEL
jgi:hypothetical protein